MKHIPNLISLSRIGFAVAIIFLMLQENAETAFACLCLGFASDWLDGQVARATGTATEFGANVVDWVCDAVLLFVAGLMLIVAGIWPFWVGVVLFVVNVLLQVTHWSSFATIKRHTRYIHPLFGLGLMLATAAAYARAAYEMSYSGIALALVVILVVLLLTKTDRMKELLAR